MLLHKNYQVFSFIVSLLFIIFPCISSAVLKLKNEGEIICIPNATFHIDCNRCKCSPTGMSIDCTDWSCTILQIPHDLLLNITVNCWAGEIFLSDNLKCICASTGDYATCSSAYYELAHNLRPTSGSIISLEKSANGKCTPGLVFKNQCDTCICSNVNDESAAACLGIKCINGYGRNKAGNCNYGVDYNQKLCVPFSTFSMNCNQCICSSDGYSFSCDSFPCLGVEMRDDQLLNITFLCEPDNIFLYNRHECLCSKSGKYAMCSVSHYDKRQEFRESNKKVFSIAEFPELCTPGMTFKDKCNICICGTNERASCTKIDCDISWKYSTDKTNFIIPPRIIPKQEIWKKTKKNSRFCNKNAGSMYCRYLDSY